LTLYTEDLFLTYHLPDCSPIHPNHHHTLTHHCRAGMDGCSVCYCTGIDLACTQIWGSPCVHL